MEFNLKKILLKLDTKKVLFLIAGIYIVTYSLKGLLIYQSKVTYWIYTISILLAFLFSWIISKLASKKILKIELLVCAGFISFFILEILVNYFIYGKIFQYDWYMATILLNLPIFLIMFSLTVTYKKDFLKFLLIILGIYSILTFISMIISATMSGIGFINFFKLITSIDTYLHIDYTNAGILHNITNFETVFLRHIMKGTGVMFANFLVYPSFFYIVFFFVFKQFLNLNRFYKVAFIISLLAVLIYNSRAMLITITLFSIINFLKDKKLIKIFILPIFTLPFTIYLVGKKFLTGRHICWDVFENFITFWGNGIGNSVIEIKKAFLEAIGNPTISYHNVHLEFIHNFGFILYFIFFILILLRFLHSDKTTRTFAYLAIYLFYHLSTENNIFDFYSFFPTSILFGLLWLQENKFIRSRFVKN